MKLKFWKKHSYFEELPEDIAPMRQLLAEYSQMPADKIDAHLYGIRDKLWAVHKYPCIGRFAFLNLGMTKSDYYKEAVARLKAEPAAENGERLLDLGCCVGQVLRQMVFEGVAPQKLAGSDLHREFIDLGFEMFGDADKESSKALTFVAGDILADDGPDPSPLDAFNKSFTMVHAANFFHLFSWDEQIKVAKRIIGFLKDDNTAENQDGAAQSPGISIFGAQLAHRLPGEHRIMPLNPRTRFLHDATTFQKLWDQVGEETGTRWKTAVTPITNGIGEALMNNPDVKYVLYGVWRV